MHVEREHQSSHGRLMTRVKASARCEQYCSETSSADGEIGIDERRFRDKDMKVTYIARICSEVMNEEWYTTNTKCL